MSATAQTVGSARPVLVATKLNVPEARRGLVPRPGLIERLTSGDGSKLTLICAPAGWGKSVLLSEWCASPQENRALGDPGDPGQPGPDGLTGYQVLSVPTKQTIQPGAGLHIPAPCPNDKVAIGGTYDSNVALGVLVSAPSPLPKSGWDFVLKNPSAQPATVAVSAICATAS